PGAAWSPAVQLFSTGHAGTERSGAVCASRGRGAATAMVDYNLINSLGNMDADVDTAVLEALGAETAKDQSKLIQGDEVQDFSPGSIIKGRISGNAGDDFIIELGLKSEGILERGEFDEPE